MASIRSIYFAINAVDNASGVFNDIADAALKLDAVLSTVEEKAGKLEAALGVLDAAGRTAAAGINDAADALARLATTTQAAADEAAKGIHIPVTIDDAGFAAQLARVIAEADAALKASPVTMPLNFDLSTAAVARAVAAAQAAFRVNPVTMPLKFDLSTAAVASAVAAAQAMFKANPVTVPLNFDVPPVAVYAAIARAQAAFRAAPVTVPLNFSSNAAAVAATNAALAETGKLTTASNTATNTGIGLWGRWGGISLTALHWIISGTAEILAVGIPALIAAGAWTAVWLEGVGNVATHMKAVYTATEATANLFHTTAGQAVGLGNALQKAQTAVDPQVYQALGSAIKIVNEQSGAFVKTGVAMSGIFDKFLASMVVGFQKGGADAGVMNGLLAHMVPDLTQIGQLFGNLGHSLLIFASDMPGLAEVLLRTFDDIGGAIKTVLGLPFAHYIVEGGMAVEEFMRWGGLLVTLLGRLGVATDATGAKFLSWTRFSGVFTSLTLAIPRIAAAITVGLGGAMSGLGAWLGKLSAAGGLGSGALAGLERGLMGAGDAVSGFGSKVLAAVGSLSLWQVGLIAVAAVGLGIMIDKIVTARSAAQVFTDSLQKATQAANGFQVFKVASDNIGLLQQKISATKTTVDALSSSTGNYAAASRQQVGELANARAALTTYHAGILQQVTDMGNVVRGSAALSREYGISMPTAISLAMAAGVNLTNNITGTSRSAENARAAIASYVQGFTSMGVPMSDVGKDIMDVGIQSSLAATKVSQLNSARDQFMTNLTSGTSALASFVTSLSNIGTVAGSVRNNLGQSTIQMTLSTTQFAKALKSFGVTGAAAWTNFNQVVGSTAPSIIDFLQTAGAEGAITGPKFNKAVLDMVASLAPLAKDSKTAQSELVGLAESAGLGVTTWPQLTKMISDSGASAKGLAPIIQGTTQNMSDMQKVAQTLGSTLNSDLTAMFNQDKIAASGVSKPLQQYTADIINGTTQTAAGQSTRTQLIADYQKLGLTLPEAITEVNSLSKGMTNNTSQTAVGHITRTQLATDLSQAGVKSSSTDAFLRKLTSSVLNNTLTAGGGHPTRKQLVNDILALGTQSGASRTLVAKMIAEVLHIPLRRALQIVMTGTGTYSVSMTSSTNPYPGGISGRKAAGGHIRGAGTATSDSIPAWLSNGEYVVQASAVHHYGTGVMDSINQGMFAAGGLVEGGNTSVLTGQYAVQKYNQFTNTLTMATVNALLAGIKMAKAAATAGGAGSPYGGAVSNGPLQQVAKQMLAAMGWASQWPAFNSIVMAESGWRVNAQNASGAYGIPQALPASKMASAGADWQTNGVTQLRWMMGYLKARWGDPNGAWANEQSQHWYSRGGPVRRAAGGPVSTPVRFASGGPTSMQKLFGYWEAHYKTWIKDHASTYGKLHGTALYKYWEAHWKRWISDNLYRVTGTAARGGTGSAAGSGSPAGAGAATTASKISGMQSKGESLVNTYAGSNLNSMISKEPTFLKDIAAYFKGSSAKWRDRTIELQTKHLASIRTSLNSVNSKIAGAQALQQSTMSSLSGSSGLSTITQGGGYVGTKFVGGGAMEELQLKAQLATLKAFSAALKKLTAMKLPASLMQELVALGPVAGLAMAQDFIQGGPSLIKQLAGTTSAITAAETGISRGVASQAYTGKYVTGANFISQLTADKTKLTKLFTEVGDAMGKEAAKWFRVPKAKLPKKYATGGLITEPVMGVGVNSGQDYSFGEAGIETVTPGMTGTSGSGRPLMNVGQLIVREEADLSILQHKLNFLVISAGLGT
jgi:hypothetical protein